MTEDVEALRGLSHAAFGQRYRLECMLAIANSKDGLVTLSGLAGQVGVAPSNLQHPIRSLVQSGLLTPLASGDSRSRFYLRNESAAWAWARELQEWALGAASSSALERDKLEG